MRRECTAVLLSAAGLLAASAECGAQEAAWTRPEFTIGIKAWDSGWQSYLPSTVAGVTPLGTPAASDVVNSVETSRHVEALPTLTLRYDRYFLSAGYARFSSDFSLQQSPLVSTSSPMTILTSRTDHLTRREIDVNAGYFVLPGLALTIGYKNAKEDRDTRLGIAPGTTAGLLNADVDVGLLGAVGSYEIQDGLSAYGQFGYGWGRARTTLGAASAVPGREISTNVRYIISELGLAYRLPWQSAWIKRSSVGLGYRSQTLKQNAPSAVGGESRDLRDVKDGFVLSLNLTI
jgi:hypothetical protein